MRIALLVLVFVGLGLANVPVVAGAQEGDFACPEWPLQEWTLCAVYCVCRGTPFFIRDEVCPTESPHCPGEQFPETRSAETAA